MYVTEGTNDKKPQKLQRPEGCRPNVILMVEKGWVS